MFSPSVALLASRTFSEESLFVPRKWDPKDDFVLPVNCWMVRLSVIERRSYGTENLQRELQDYKFSWRKVLTNFDHEHTFLKWYQLWLGDYRKNFRVLHGEIVHEATHFSIYCRTCPVHGMPSVCIRIHPLGFDGSRYCLFGIFYDIPCCSVEDVWVRAIGGLYCRACGGDSFFAHSLQVCVVVSVVLVDGLLTKP